MTRGAGGRNWRPSAGFAALEFRARVLSRIRAFFSERGVLEVTTPLLAPAAATDPQIDSIAVPRHGRRWWLQSSPEFHMKRLLAAGSGPIYQIAPAFREDEQGRWHNPEFTLLEWYRPGLDHHGLMDELAELLAALGGPAQVERRAYAELLRERLDLDLDTDSDEVLRSRLERDLGSLPADLDRDGLLDAAMGLLIGPRLGTDTACLVYDYPASQAALARLGPAGRACRFELYWQGLELANGFFELGDAAEQRRRFERDLRTRRRRGQSEVVMDEALLAALAHGLPDCAGVALGLDRLVALLAGAAGLDAVLPFAEDRA